MTPSTFLNDIRFLLFKNLNRIYAKLSELIVLSFKTNNSAERSESIALAYPLG